MIFFCNQGREVIQSTWCRDVIFHSLRVDLGAIYQDSDPRYRDERRRANLAHLLSPAPEHCLHCTRVQQMILLFLEVV